MAVKEYQDRERADLKCYVRSLECDFWKRKGVLWMAEENNVDMVSCIRLFLAIDPEIRFITTMAGEKKDTCYERIGDTSWEAIEHRHGHRMGVVNLLTSSIATYWSAP